LNAVCIYNVFEVDEFFPSKSSGCEL